MDVLKLSMEQRDKTHPKTQHTTWYGQRGCTTTPIQVTTPPHLGQRLVERKGYQL